MAKDIWTTPHPDGWQNIREGASKASSVHKTKAVAVKVGREMAINSKCEHLIQKQNGQIGERNTYSGSDPCPPRDKK